MNRFYFFLIFFLLIHPFSIQAQEISVDSNDQTEPPVSLNGESSDHSELFFDVEAQTAFILDEETAKKGYSTKVFDDQFVVGISNNAVQKESVIQFKKNPVFSYGIPSGKARISDIFEYDIQEKKFYDSTKPIFLEIHFSKPNIFYKQIYFWDSSAFLWRPLPGKSNNKEKFVRAAIHLPFARIAIFEDVGIMEEGSASWYGFRNCDCAASPDYSIGTKLKITSLDSGKNLTVTVNDYGPERSTHPDRVIDLDKVAFKKLASLGEGILSVKVEPLWKNSSTVLAASVPVVKKTNVSFLKDIQSKAAIVIDAHTREVLWGKNYTDKLPIASLTKLMTAQIFLDTHTPWEKVVTYKESDSAIGSRLYVYPGETMTTRDLFFSMLLGSTNNAARTLVRGTALGEGQFTELMNKKSAEWGLLSTKFFDPTGLDSKNMSTAYELALIAGNVLNNAVVLEATTLPFYSFSTINTKEKHTIKNTNILIKSDFYITGGKTGYLDEAGYCLMTRAKDKNENEVIAIVLGSPDNQTRFDETKILLEWGLNQLAEKI